MLPLPAASCATFCASDAVTVPLDDTGTLTVYVVPDPVTDATPCVAVPPTVTSAAVKSLTDSLNTTVKLTGLVLVGSAWPAAWLTVTDGRTLSNVTELSVEVEAAFPAAPLWATLAASEAVTVPLVVTGTVTV